MNEMEWIEYGKKDTFCIWFEASKMIEKFRFYKFDCKMPSANLNFHLRLNELDVYCVKVQCRAIESLRIALDFEKKKMKF